MVRIAFLLSKPSSMVFSSGARHRINSELEGTRFNLYFPAIFIFTKLTSSFEGLGSFIKRSMISLQASSFNVNSSADMHHKLSDKPAVHKPEATR
jgi:hypothetical protein